jgi:dipeptidyl aminopeptidase/acylaminoacyl peptidase
MKLSRTKLGPIKFGQGFRSLVFVITLALGGSFAFAQQSSAPRPIGIDDLFDFRDVHDAQISPEGQFIAFTVTTSSLKDDKTETRVWMIPASGGEPVALTAEGQSSDHPRWSPDGKSLAFLSDRNESKTQLYLLNRLGGEAQRLTELPQDVEDFAWSPDSQRVVLVLRDASPDELEAAAKKKDEGDEKDPTPAKKSKAQRPWVIDRLQYKEDTIGYLDRRRTHLYVMDIASKAKHQITGGDYDDSEPVWSPDGKLLAFSSNRSKPDPDANYNSDIWTVAADNKDMGAHLTQITTNPGEDKSPAWSHDGKWIAYSSMLDPKLFQYATKYIAISPAAGGEAKVLTKSFDRMATQPRFTLDGKGVYFNADDDGTQNLCLVNIADNKITRPIGGRLSLEGYSISKDGSIAAVLSTMELPGEVYSLPGGKLTRLTRENDVWLGKFKFSKGEYVSFPSKDGTIVHGYLYKPLDYVAGKKYPTLLRPHGGPVWAYYAEFQDLAQLFAANGYAVLLPNPRGSTGYGEPFAKAIWADWGNLDYQDDMAMVDYAIAQGIADPDKLGVGGWSYGGISTDFIIGNTNRFKAAISGAGSAEMTSMWGHDQYQKDYTLELGYPWENREKWEHVAPFYKVKNIRTPSLFVGGNIDWNVPILGGEQMYQALKVLGRETELVVYPDEYHEFKTPSHIKDLYERFLAWYAHYVKADGTPARPAPEKSAKETKAAS